MHWKAWVPTDYDSEDPFSGGGIVPAIWLLPVPDDVTSDADATSYAYILITVTWLYDPYPPPPG
jgi:hypothetical protein